MYITGWSRLKGTVGSHLVQLLVEQHPLEHITQDSDQMAF